MLCKPPGLYSQRASLVPRLPFQLSVACSTGKVESKRRKAGREAWERGNQRAIVHGGITGDIEGQVTYRFACSIESSTATCFSKLLIYSCSCTISSLLHSSPLHFSSHLLSTLPLSCPPTPSCPPLSDPTYEEVH